MVQIPSSPHDGTTTVSHTTLSSSLQTSNTSICAHQQLYSAPEMPRSMTISTQTYRPRMAALLPLGGRHQLQNRVNTSASQEATHGGVNTEQIQERQHCA